VFVVAFNNKPSINRVFNRFARLRAVDAEALAAMTVCFDECTVAVGECENW